MAIEEEEARAELWRQNQRLKAQAILLRNQLLLAPDENRRALEEKYQALLDAMQDWGGVAGSLPDESGNVRNSG